VPPVNYRVSEPGVVKDAFRSLLDRAQSEGRLALVLRAARYVWDELAYDPAHLGESRARFHALDLDFRITFSGPLVVEFTVHEPTRQVFVRRVGLVS
jgi:hypothetical protein